MLNKIYSSFFKKKKFSNIIYWKNSRGFSFNYILEKSINQKEMEIAHYLVSSKMYQ